MSLHWSRDPDLPLNVTFHVEQAWAYDSAWITDNTFASSDVQITWGDSTGFSPNRMILSEQSGTKTFVSGSGVDWMSGYADWPHRYQTANTFVAGILSVCCRLSTLQEFNGGTSYKIFTSVNLTGSNVVFASPRISMLPVIGLRNGQLSRIYFPIFYPRNYVLTFATAAQSGLNTPSPLGSSIVGGTYMQWTPSTVGLYATQIRIQDSLVPSVYTPCDFIINVTATTTPVPLTPILIVVQAPLVIGSTIYLETGHVVTVLVRTNSSVGLGVTVESSVLPPNATLSECLEGVQGSDPPYSIGTTCTRNLTWAPTTSVDEVYPYIMFGGQDQNRVPSSNQTTLFFSSTPPDAEGAFRYMSLSWSRSTSSSLSVMFHLEQAWAVNKSATSNVTLQGSRIEGVQVAINWGDGTGLSSQVLELEYVSGHVYFQGLRAHGTGSDWMLGSADLPHTFASAAVFDVGIRGTCCRLETLQEGNGGTPFSVFTTVDLTSSLLGSPRVSALPVYGVRQSSPTSFLVPIVYSRSFTSSFRASPASTGLSQNGPLGSSFTTFSRWQWTPTTVGLYTAQIQVADTLVPSVFTPVEIMINVTSIETVVPSTPTLGDYSAFAFNGFNFSIGANDTLWFLITANSSLGVGVNIEYSVLPPNATISECLEGVDPADPPFSLGSVCTKNFSWTPTTTPPQTLLVFASRDIYRTPSSSQAVYQIIPIASAPVIFGINPSNGPTQGGNIITIRGRNFGSSASGLTIAIGPYSCTSPLFSSGNILCIVQAGQGENHLVTVSTSGRSSEPFCCYRYNAPTFTSVSSPAGAGTEGGYIFTITGTNFGQTGQTLTIDSVNQATLVNCPTLTGATHTCRFRMLPADGGALLPIQLTVGGQTSAVTAASVWTFTAPNLTTYAVPSAPPTGGTNLTITGFNFGQPSSAETFVWISGNPCTGVIHTHRVIYCTLPAGSGTMNPIVVQVAGQNATNLLFFAYDPFLFDIQPSSQFCAGDLMTLTGINLGTGPTLPGDGVFVDDLLVPFLEWNDTTIVIEAPATSGSPPQAVYVVTRGNRTNSLLIDDVPLTLVIAKPNPGPSTGGVTLTLVGTGFDTSSSPMVTVGSQPCPLEFFNDSVIECTLPPGCGNVTLELTVCNETLMADYAYESPTIFSVHPQFASCDGNIVLMIIGNGFSLSTQVNVSVGGSDCAVVFQNSTIVECILPPGGGVNQTVLVHFCPGQNPLVAPSYSYAPANVLIASIEPSDGPCSGGTLLTITGSGFGSVPINVTVGNAPCDLLFSNDTQIVCTVRPGLGVNLTISILVCREWIDVGVWSYVGGTFTLSSIEPDSGPCEGGGSLVIRGTNLDNDITNVTIGGSPCVMTALNDTVLMCIIPPGQGIQDIQIQICGFWMTIDTFAYVPTILISDNLPDTGSCEGTRLTIIGSGFLGCNAAFVPSVFVGPDALTCVLLEYNDTFIACELEPGQGANLDVVVAVDGYFFLAPNPFSFDPPILLSILPTSLPTAGGTLTIQGSGFGTDGSVWIDSTIPCVPILLYNCSLITCSYSPGQGCNHTLRLESGNQTSNLLQFNFTGPTTTPIVPHPRVPTVGGTIVCIHGTNLGQNATVFVLLESVSPQALVLNQTDTTLCFVAPAGTGVNRSVIVTIGCQSSLRGSLQIDYVSSSISSSSSSSTGRSSSSSTGRSSSSTGRACPFNCPSTSGSAALETTPWQWAGVFVGGTVFVGVMAAVVGNRRRPSATTTASNGQSLPVTFVKPTRQVPLDSSLSAGTIIDPDSSIGLHLHVS